LSDNTWEQFFNGHAPVYMDNVFTKNTIAEADFIIEELKLPQGCFILDVGCGTGRHAVELARRGFRVTGVDISKGMLDQARAAAAEAGVEIELVRADVSKRLPPGPFDVALCLCEGAFGLLGDSDSSADHDLSILANINGALADGAPLMLTALNALAMIRRVSDEDVRSGRFDPQTLVEEHEMEYDTPEGKKPVLLRERSFVPSELALLMDAAGFQIEHIGGGTAGNWGRRGVELDEMEIMVIARKVVDVA